MQHVEQEIQERLISIEPKVFEDICQDLLSLLGVHDLDDIPGNIIKKDIERYENSCAAGKDITVKFQTTDTDSDGNYILFSWWVECKRYKNNVNPKVLGANIFHILQEDPPPPHLLLIMVAKDVTSSIKNGIKKLSRLELVI